MSSEVDICNLALAHLGDTATIASINPPEGSAQAEHCSRFYPIARDSLLEMHPWGFATKRVTLALLTITLSEWNYVYQLPNGVINLIAVLPPGNSDDYSVKATYPSQYGYNPEIIPAAGYYVPQPYQYETIDDVQVIMTDQKDAVLRYTAIVTDTTRFSPLFVTTLSWYLASMLAGPVIKGDAGAAEGKRCLQMFQAHLVEATASDAVQRNIKPNQIVSWISGR
jgi:hypothetical protein